MRYLLLLCFLFFAPLLRAQQQEDYLQEVKAEMKKTWPHNRAINLVFHGHSVPAGYFRTPVVNTLNAYPYLVLRSLKALYPDAVINVIVTAIGGENSVQGANRFRKTVLNHQPDVLFIDYALNDRSIGLEASKAATEKMIREALKKGIKVILLTPSPDIGTEWQQSGNPLRLLSEQIIALSKQYHTGLVDSYDIFSRQQDVRPLMAQSNHPNEKGHQLIADGITAWFK